MEDSIPFVKMHGAGNDFILIDNRFGFFEGTENAVFQDLCRRRFGIGADGLMLLNFQKSDHFSLLYFNADGKPAEMCGNGARCAVYFMHLLNLNQRLFSFEISGKKYSGEITGSEKVKILWDAKPAIKKVKGLEKSLLQDFKRILFINSGVPHLVLETNMPLESVDVSKWGSCFRNHSSFAPDGANVNFIQIEKDRVKIRTFERGVEGETMACGTGAVAAALAVAYWGDLELPVEITARGGVLRVGQGSAPKSAWLEGAVQPVYYGLVDLSQQVSASKK